MRNPLRRKNFSGTPGGTRTPNLLIRSQDQGVCVVKANQPSPLCAIGIDLSAVCVISAAFRPLAYQMRTKRGPHPILRLTRCTMTSSGKECDGPVTGTRRGPDRAIGDDRRARAPSGGRAPVFHRYRHRIDNRLRYDPDIGAYAERRRAEPKARPTARSSDVPSATSLVSSSDNAITHREPLDNP